MLSGASSSYMRTAAGSESRIQFTVYSLSMRSRNLSTSALSYVLAHSTLHLESTPSFRS